MPKPRRLPAWLAGSGVIAVSMGVQNIGTYGFTLVAARMLGPGQYGAIAALMGLLLVLTVVSLGLQATGARRVSAAPGTLTRTERRVVAASYRAAAVLAAVTLLSTPVLSDLLRLDSWTAIALLAVATVPLTLMGAYAGIFQGERRWLPLAAVYAGMGMGRLGLGVVGMLWREDVVGAMAGVALGNAVPALVGWWFLRHPARVTATTAGRAAPDRPEGSVLGEVLHNSHVLLAFFALSNVDVLLARVLLDDHEGGLYAGGLILAKAVLFLPQFVVVIAFPSMVDDTRTRMQTQALALVAVIGGVATVGAWLLAPVAILFIGGSAYAELQGWVWAFAGVGTLLAMLQLVVYGTVARQHRGAVFVLWAGLAALVAAGSAVSSIGELLARVAVVHAVVLLGLFTLNRQSGAVASHPEPRTVP